MANSPAQTPLADDVNAEDQPSAELAGGPANRASTSSVSDERPLSYGDLRRLGLLVLGLVIGGAILRAAGDVLLLFAVVFLSAAALNPLVSWLQGRGLRRGLAVVIVMLGLIALLCGIVALIVPPLAQQGQELAQRAPQFARNIQTQADKLAQRYPQLSGPISQLRQLDLPDALQKRSGDIGQFVLKNLGTVVGGVVGGVFGALVALLLLVFTLSNPYPLVSGLLRVTPPRHRDAMGRTVARFLTQMGAWAKATLINGTITGVSTGLLLYWIGVKPALVFGIMAFFGEFVPNIGPVVAASPALFVALGSGPEKAGLALLAILFVQQVESNLLVPFVMGRSLELHPVSIVFFALAMGALFNVTGAILAVPAAVLVKIVWEEWVLRPRGDLGSRESDALNERSRRIVSGEDPAAVV